MQSVCLAISVLGDVPDKDLLKMNDSNYQKGHEMKAVRPLLKM